MSAKHTPGPWASMDTGEIYYADGSVEPVIAIVQYENTTDEQFIADCRLIAAAPDLLAALKYIAKTWPDTFAARDARAAIARATGAA